MNKKEKIDYFVENIDWDKIISRWRLSKNLPNRFEKEEFKTYWRQNFYLRPGQALINLGLIPDGNVQWEDTYNSLLNTCHKNT